MVEPCWRKWAAVSASKLSCAGLWLKRRTPEHAGIISLSCRAVQVRQAERPLLRNAQERDSHRHMMCGGKKRPHGNASAHCIVERLHDGQRRRARNNSSRFGRWSAGSAELAPEKSHCGHAPGSMEAGIRTLRLRSTNKRR